MGKFLSKGKKSTNSPKETEKRPGDIDYKGRTPRVPKDSDQEFSVYTDPPITGHNNSIDSSKRNETITGSTQYHDVRPEDNIFGNKDIVTHFNVNTKSAEYSKSFSSSESTNRSVQTTRRVTEHAIIEYIDIGGNDITDQLDSGSVSHNKSGTASCPIVQTAKSENDEQTIPMAKEDKKETKKKKKKKKKKRFITSVNVSEQQVKTMTMEAERLAEHCRFDIEMSKRDDQELILCPKAFIQSISSVEKHISKLTWENSKLVMERNEYLNRLSSAAAARYRPMKLADKFNKIYDDEWTDMIERLEKKGSKTEEHQDKCVYHLYSVLIVIFYSLSKKAEVQLQGLAEHLFLLTKPSTEQIDATWYDYKEERVQLIASRKQIAETTILMLHRNLQTDPIFVQELRACSPPLEDVMLYDIVASEYFMKCVEICWYFVIQDPPMYVETVSLKGTKIDKDTHKVYTKSGDIVKYHVWPALYLHHQDGTNGPMMGKGVVQPK